MRKQLALLAMAPLMGAAFVVFLPVIGFALLGYAAVLKVADKIALDRKVIAA